ncbi:hypothetical protein DOY81_014508 [Sarcophaga bullata]|nr:hypothetical protein DOY81_014508 [Sarcophaga bullata]
MNNQKPDKQNTADSWFKILNFRNSIHRTSLRFTYLEHLKQRYAKELLLIPTTDTLTNRKLVSDIRQHHERNVGEKISNTRATEIPTRKKNSFFQKLFNHQTNVEERKKKLEEEDKEVDGFVWIEDPIEKEKEKERERKKNSLKWKIRKYFLQNPDEEDKEVKSQDDSDYIVDDFVVIQPETLKELRKESKFKERFIDFTAGSLAGIAQVYVSQPLDTVKVKLQTYPKLYHGMFNCFMQTYRHHGVSRGLYAGTVPAVVASVAENSVLFTAYSGFQNLIAFVMEIDKVCELSVLANACAGSMAAIFSTLALCPTELVKCKLQAIQEVGEYLSKDSKVVPISAYKLTKDIYLKEGISGFYSGLTSTFVREIPGVFIFFGSYEATREYLRQ